MNITSLPEDLSIFKNLISLDLSNNPIEDYILIGKSLSTLPQLKELHIDLTTIENVEIILKLLPNLKVLNDKPIQPNLFTEEKEESNNNNNSISNSNKKNISNNNNELNIQNNNLNPNNSKEIPDGDIESEISNYDVSNIILLYNILANYPRFNQYY